MIILKLFFLFFFLDSDLKVLQFKLDVVNCLKEIVNELQKTNDIIGKL